MTVWTDTIPTVSEETHAKVAALVRERDVYRASGREDRVAAVEAELSRLGVDASPPAKRSERRPAPKRETR